MLYIKKPPEEATAPVSSMADACTLSSGKCQLVSKRILWQASVHCLVKPGIDCLRICQLTFANVFGIDKKIF